MDKRLAVPIAIFLVLISVSAPSANATLIQKGYWEGYPQFTTSVTVQMWLYTICRGCTADGGLVYGFYDNYDKWVTLGLINSAGNFLYAEWEPEELGGHIIASGLTWGRTYEFKFELLPSQCKVTLKDTVTAQTWIQTHPCVGTNIGGYQKHNWFESADDVKSHWAPGTWGRMKVPATGLQVDGSYPSWIIVSKGEYGTYSWITWTRQA